MEDESLFVEEPLLLSKSAIKNKTKPTLPVEASLPAAPSKKLKRTLTEKQLEQRRKAASSRVKKQAHAKKKTKFLESLANMFDEDEEGLMRRWNGDPQDTVQADVVEETPLPAVPAAQELPEEQGLTENKEATHIQSYGQSEMVKVLRNEKVKDFDFIRVNSLASMQRFAPNIDNEVRFSQVEQGVVFLPLPTYHRSG